MAHERLFPGDVITVGDVNTSENVIIVITEIAYKLVLM